MKPILTITRCWLLLAGVAMGAQAGVLSYTLGIDVNCPSGLGE